LSNVFGVEDHTLYSFAKVLGYQFKPVSFWVSEKRILAEVCNTFGERHAYLLYRKQTLKVEKRFHVSPFCDLNGYYEFDVQSSPFRFSAAIDFYDQDDVPALVRTRMSGELVPISLRSVSRALFSYPLFSLSVITRIHWQALRLWLKKIPWFPKPRPPLHALTQTIDHSSTYDKP
jgi:uncharacterized protein